MLNQLAHMTVKSRKVGEVGVNSFVREKEKWVGDMWDVKFVQAIPLLWPCMPIDSVLPPIVTIGGTRYREEVITDHEKHACHEAAVKAKRQQELRMSDPLCVPLIAGLRHMEDLFHKVGSFMLDHNDAQPFLYGAGHHEY